MSVKVTVELGNLDKAQRAWGDDMPLWIGTLARACDATSQREVGDRLGRSGPYISRVINRTYTGSYEEAEQLVRSILGCDEVLCPVWQAPIPLAACIRNRRRKAPPRTQMHHAYARVCRGCANNTDREGDRP
jgi:hypothetical protein